MKSDYTHINVILDRSGSMQSIKDDIIGGFNTFLDEQRNQPGTATLSLVQFDSQDPYEVCCRFQPIHDVPELNAAGYIPRASTPLLDCLGRGMTDLESSISSLKEDQKPAKVIFAVVTDGQENSSQEFTKEHIVRMINDRTKMDDWQFVFLSADLAAISDAVSYGVQADTALLFNKTGKGTRDAWASFSRESADYRSGEKFAMGFMAEDRTHPDDPLRNHTHSGSVGAKPYKRTYVVVPDTLWGGCYPGDQNPKVSRIKLNGLLDCGIGLVINLMEPNERGHHGEPFAPYEETLKELAAQRGRTIDIVRHDIRDHSVSTITKMSLILDTIDQAIAQRIPALVHCWGGKGRTATVMGCWLARHGIANGPDVVRELNRLRRESQDPTAHVSVPRNHRQVEMVQSWRRGA